MHKKNGSRAPRARSFRGLLISAVLLLSIVALLSVGTGNTVAFDPHVVSGTVYDQNGTAVDNDTVTVLNVRTQESTNVTGNATGIYAYNLLNLPSGWAYGDVIQITGYNGTQTGINSTSITIGDTSTNIDVWIGTITNISGINFYIIGEDGYPVDSALINIKDNSGDIVTTKMSDSDGKASTTLGDGLYTITVGKSGYDDQVILARVHGSNTYSVRLGDKSVGISLTNFWYWFLIIFACIGIIGLLLYLAKVMK